MKRLLLLVLCTPLLMGAASRAFDDANDEVNWGDVGDIGSAEDHSWGMWVKLTEDASDDAGFVKWNAAVTADAQGWALYQNTSDVPVCMVGDGGAGDTLRVAGTTDIDGVWAWVVCTYTPTGDTVTTYVNNVSENSGSDTGVGTVGNAINLTNGETDSDSSDVNGLGAYAQKEFGQLWTVQTITELMWHPCGVPRGTGFNRCHPLWQDNPEVNLTSSGTGTVSGTDAGSTDGPPVMLGGYLPL